MLFVFVLQIYNVHFYPVADLDQVCQQGMLNVMGHGFADGIEIPASTPIIRTQTINSTNVNPFSFR